VISLVVAVGLPVVIGLGLDRGYGLHTFANRQPAAKVEAPPPLRRGGSIALAGARSSITIGPELAAYRVVYKVESHNGPHPTVASQTISVRRPFDARIEQRSGAPPGVGALSVRVTRLATVAVTQTDRTATALSPAPAPAGSDLRPGISLTDAIAAHVVQRREQREVLGRPCQVFRAGGAIAAGELVPYAGSHESDDFCVDRAGLVLEDVWIKDGVWLQRRVAVAVTESPALTDDEFQLIGEELLPFQDGNGSVRAIDPASAPTGRGWLLNQAPAGFALVGRFAVTPPASKPANVTDSSPAFRDSASVIDVYTRGPDVIEVEQGIASSPAVGKFKPSPVATPVDLGELGRGEALLDLRANEVRAGFGDGRFVRVFGTVGLLDIADVARRLHPVDGTGLRYL
jgi:hypothetical protein